MASRHAAWWPCDAATASGQTPGPLCRSRLASPSHLCSFSLALTLSRLQQQQRQRRHPAIAAEARSSFISLLRPSPSNSRPPLTLSRHPAPSAHAQPTSVSPTWPRELTRASSNSGELSAHVALPFPSAIGLDSERFSFALPSRTFSLSRLAHYQSKLARPRRAAPPCPPCSTTSCLRYSIGIERGTVRFVSRRGIRWCPWPRRRPRRRRVFGRSVAADTLSV